MIDDGSAARGGATESPCRPVMDAVDEGRELAGDVLALAVETTEVRGRTSPGRVEGIVIGRVVDAGADGVTVDHPVNASGVPLPALCTVAVAAADAGREVALAFERGDPARPIVLGLIHRPVGETGREEGQAHAGITADGERISLTASREIVLRCGAASITLTRAGKVLIRGASLLSRSTGVNRIKGGSVQIN